MVASSQFPTSASQPVRPSFLHDSYEAQEHVLKVVSRNYPNERLKPKLLKFVMVCMLDLPPSVSQVCEALNLPEVLDDLLRNWKWPSLFVV
jgi:hypothetical protein